ncbi:putative non-specific serine/threonine protein kinase [Helianthus annuus]|nr:putative non-specific serine/threonine protein kinase [Helianthus annuus]
MKLETLSLGSNRLSGHLPTRVRFSGSLLFFSVNNNSFSGPVPSTIKNCSKLIRLRFEGNQITGNVTDALSYNGLTGGLPQQFGGLKMLETLNISHNNFTELEGRVPDMQVFQQAPFEAVENNKGLCGNITGLKDCPRTHVNEKTKNNQGLMILILVPTICLVL